MVLRKITLLLLIVFPFTGAWAQRIEKTLIMTLPDTGTAILRSARMNFGNGNDAYSYFAHEPWVVMTNEGTYGPFRKIEGKGMAWLFYNVKDKDQYIKSMNAPEMYGPLNGTIDYASTSQPGGIAFTVSAGDSITYYINGKRVAVTDSSTVIDRWCNFSKNGYVVYTIKKGKWNYLFANDRLLDSSTYYYDRLNIDEHNNYSYALGIFEEETGPCDNHYYRFKAMAHPPQPVFSPQILFGSMVWKYNDTILYYGNSDGLYYPYCSMNERAAKKFNGTVLINGNSIFSYSYLPEAAEPTELPRTEVCANGQGRYVPYSKIFFPCVDSMGHFALFGRRGYYLYKNVDGEEAKEALTKHGVRAVPVSIDTRGNTICYYQTEDSVYVYENDRRFRSCPVAKFEARLRDYSIWHSADDNSLPVLCMDSSAYIVYNNAFSPALKRIGHNEYRSDPYICNTGNVVYARHDEHGYWLIQKTGIEQYDLIINNRRVALPSGINFEGPMYDDLAYNFKLTAGEFIFYVKDNSNIVRYKITL